MTLASAPGKIILFGEHAVVYGRPAIAVPVRQVRATAEVIDLQQAAPSRIKLEAPDIRFSEWLHEAIDHPIARIVQLCLRELGATDFPSLCVRVTSTIPIAAGLGSGAAVSVAVARALGKHLGHPFPPERLSALAYQVEQLHHGTPSGIDNTVVAFERPVYFVRGQPPSPFEIPTPFHIVIADSGQPSPTAVAVGQVRQRWQADCEREEALFDAIGQTTDKARSAIETGRIEEVGPLMDQNQVLLEALGVSTPALQGLLSAARATGARGAKLSGAGLGGNMIALVDPEQAEAVEAALKQAGAIRTIRTEVGP
jgi:mevalonate kinase